MKKKILVADDEHEIVEFLASFLERFGFIVIKARGGKEAVALFQQHRPDCVFLDIQMPDIDGIAVLEAVKSLDEKIKVIMITGREDQELREKATEYGALDYVTKPLDLGELKEKINQYLL